MTLLGNAACGTLQVPSFSAPCWPLPPETIARDAVGCPRIRMSVYTFTYAWMASRCLYPPDDGLPHQVLYDYDPLDGASEEERS